MKKDRIAELREKINDSYLGSPGLHLEKIVGECLDAIESLQAENEKLRVQLAGCGVAAMCNTVESMEKQLVKEGDYGWSASYSDVLKAVKREMKYREALIWISSNSDGVRLIPQKANAHQLKAIEALSETQAK